jgi:heme oxygenase (biliverdin-producing, ferredoxin)
MSTPLSHRLREATRDLHQQLERGAFIQSLLRGDCRREDYAAYLSLLAPIYTVLEELLQGGAAAELATLAAPYRRSAALQRDLAFFGVRACSDDEVPLARHLRHLALHAPHRLTAIVYIRYLGDLSGGQVVAKLLRRHLGLQEDGLAFYHFDTFPDIAAAKSRLRQELDDLPLSPSQLDDVEDEARACFTAHIEAFATLRPMPPPLDTEL